MEQPSSLCEAEGRPATASTNDFEALASQRARTAAAADAGEGLLAAAEVAESDDGLFVLPVTPFPSSARRISSPADEEALLLQSRLSALSVSEAERPSFATCSEPQTERARLVEELQNRLVGLLRQEVEDEGESLVEDAAAALPSGEQRQLQFLLQQLQSQQRQIAVQQRRLRTLRRAKMLEQTELLQRRLLAEQLLDMQTDPCCAEQSGSSSLAACGGGGAGAALGGEEWLLPTLLKNPASWGETPPSALPLLGGCGSDSAESKASSRRRGGRRRGGGGGALQNVSASHEQFPTGTKGACEEEVGFAQRLQPRSSVSTVAPRSSVSSAGSASSPRASALSFCPSFLPAPQHPPLQPPHATLQHPEDRDLPSAAPAAGAPPRVASSGISLPSLQQRMQKTKLCRFHILSCCSRGRLCVFAHSLEELRERPNLRRTKMCPALQQQGGCSRGELCNFAHSEGELRSTPEFYKTSICSAVASGKTCPMGSSCRFAHSEGELRSRRPGASRGFAGALPKTGPFARDDLWNVAPPREIHHSLQALQHQVYLQFEQQVRQQRALAESEGTEALVCRRLPQEVLRPSPQGEIMAAPQGLPSSGIFSPEASSFFPSACVWPMPSPSEEGGAGEEAVSLRESGGGSAASTLTPREREVCRQEMFVASAPSSAACPASAVGSGKEVLVAEAKPAFRELQTAPLECGEAISEQSTCAQCPFLAAAPPQSTQRSAIPNAASEPWLATAAQLLEMGEPQREKR